MLGTFVEKALVSEEYRTYVYRGKKGVLIFLTIFAPVLILVVLGPRIGLSVVPVAILAVAIGKMIDKDLIRGW